jgi:autotransporter-associated beta strand protein
MTTLPRRSIVSNSQRIRANAVWLMNAASLAVAIGAINQVAKKSNLGTGLPGLVSEVKALDFYWTGTTGGSWGSTSPAAGTATWTWGTASGGAATTTYMGGATGNSLAGAYSTDKFYFGAAGGSGTNITQSGNQVTGGIYFNSGASSYTIIGSNQRMITLGGGGTSSIRGYAVGSTQASGAWSAASTSSGSYSGGIYNNASGTTQTFNTAIRVEGNGNAGTNINASTISAVSGATMVFAGTKAASYVINPYALEYYGYQTGATTSSAAQIAGSSAYLAAGGASTSGQAFALSSGNAGFLDIAGAGTIRITGSIDNGTRLNSASTVGVGSGGTGSLKITSSGTTYLAGWNTYTGTTVISNGTVVVLNPYAFGGNRTTDTTAVGANGTGTAALGNYGQYNGFNASSSASFGNVTLNAGGTIDLSGTTMVGTNALIINGTGAATASGALQNSSATSATYAGAVTLGSASTINAGSGNLTLSGGLNTATYDATVSGAQNTSVTGVLSGTGSINKTGAGTLTLSGNNTYTGSINIEQGVVSLAAGSGSALGTGTGALSFGASNTPTLTLGGRSVTMGNISSTNVNSVIQNNNLTAATFTSSAPGSTTFAGKLSDGAAGGKLSFVKAGNGTLTLSNTQDFTGTTTIAGGTLNLTGSTKTGSAVTVNSGATLSGSGTVNDSLTVSGSISPGTAGVGTLTAGATNLQSGGTLNVQIYNFSGLAGSTGWDLLTSTGAITVNSTADTLASKFTINISSISNSNLDTVGNALNFTKGSDYTLKILTGTSVTGFDASKFNVTGSLQNVGAGIWSVAQSGNDINLLFTALNSLNWNGSSGWDGTNNNGGDGSWSTASVGYDTGSVLIFAGTAGAVTVGNVATSKAIKFQADGYTLSDGTITLTGADSATNNIDVGSGFTATIGSKIVSSTSTIFKTGTGTLVLSGANGSSGISSGLTVSAGRLQLGSADALGSSGSAVTVVSGATLDLNGQSVSNTNTLNLSGAGAASAGGALINTSNTAASYAGLVTLSAATTINASSGSISLTNAGTITGSGFALTVDGSSDTSIASIIGTGTAGITKNGTGTLTLSGVNTYTGATTVSAGGLKLANAGALGSSGSSYSATTIVSGATLDLNGQSVINSNTLNLSGTGAASAGGALINTSNTAASYAGLVTLSAATTINASSGSISLTNAGTITGSGFGLTVTGGNDTSIASIIGTGAGTLTKTGTGTLTLSGANTYTGGTTVSAGRLKLGNATALGGSAAGVTVASGATLDLNGQTTSNTNVLTLSGTGVDSAGGALINTSNITASYAGNINLAADATIKATSGNITLANIGTAASRALTITGDYDTTITALTTSLTLNYIKNGTGTLNLGANARLTVAQANTHQFNAGIVRQNSTQPFGSSGTGVGAMTGLSITSVSIADGASFDLNGLSQLKTVNVIMSGTGAAGAGGPIYNSSATTNAKFQGNFLMSGSTALISNNAGLELGASGSTGTGINLKNYDLTLGGTSTSAGNVISSILVGTGNLIKTGTGTWKLTPTGNSGFYYFDTSTSGAQYSSAANANIFTGSISISAGTLVMGNTGALGSSSGVTVADGGTLDLNGLTLSTSNALTISGTGAAGAGGSIVNNSASLATYSGLITLNNDATINAQAGNINITGATLSSTNKTLTVAGSFNTNITSAMGFGSGGLTKTGTGSLTLSGANTYTGTTTVSAGTLKLGNTSALGDSSSNVVVSNGATLDLGGLSIANTNTLTISGTGAGTAGATGALTSSSTTASYAGNITLADAATIYATAGDIILSGVISGNKQLTILNSSATKDVILTGASANTMGSINLAGYDLTFTAVNQLGLGTITSSSSNARLVYGTSAGSSNLAPITIENQLNTGADSSKILALVPNGDTNSITASGLITGSGKLKVSGSGVGGVLYVTNTSNDFTGGIEIGTGTIQVADSRALGSGAINFGTSTASILSFTDSTTVANSVTMSGSSYTANIDVSSGKTATLSGVISPTTTGGKLTKTGNGSLVLSNTNTYSGATTVSAGTLTLSGSGSIASSAVTVANSATLKATNSSMPDSAITGAITLSSGALVDLTAGSLKSTTLTVATLSGSDVTNISYTLGNSLALTGAPTLTGNLNLTVNGTSAVAGTNNLITWSGSKSGAGYFTSTLNNTPNGLRGVLKTASASVSADYYALATADASQTVNVGNVRVGVNKTAALTLTNNSVAGIYSENLSSNGFSNVSTGFTATGTAAIAAGASGSGNLTVGITAASAGTQSGSATLALQSTAVNSSGLSAYNLSSQAITITGTAYDIASPTYVTTAKDFGNVRAGASVSDQNINFANTTITNANYQDSLAVSGSKTNSKISLGTVSNITAGNNANLSVTANTATAGSLADTITLTLTSNANGVSGLSNSSITPTGTIAVTGAVYDYAQAKFSGSVVDFGFVHQGATVSSQNVAIGNAAISNASFQDKLDVSGSSDNAGVSVTGFTGLAASASGATTSNLAVGASSSTLGSLNGTLSLTLTSNANGVSGLSNDTATRAGSGDITTTGTVYSGQATWAGAGNGSWGTLGTGFGSNWGSNQGSPGLDSGFTNTDTATFAGSIQDDSYITLSGASPKLKSITFNNTDYSYTLEQGSGGVITMNAGAGDSAATISVTGNHTISAPIAGSSNITKTGNGKLTLSGVNTYTGATTISAGTLNIASTGSIASSDVTVANAATLKATNSSVPTDAIAGAITLNSGALVDLTAGSFKATSLTVGALSGADVTKISYTIGNSFALTGGLTLNGTLTLDLTSAITGEGVYDVLTWGETKSGTGSISIIDHSTADWIMSGVETSGKYTIKVVSAFTSGSPVSGSGTVTIPSGSTVGTVSGTVTVSAAATTTVGAVSGGTVNLSGTNNTVGAISGGTVNLNASGSTVAELATGGSLNVKANSTITSLTGGTLSVDSGIDAAVASGTSTAKITGAGNLVKSGSDKLTLSGTESDYTGATKVTGGELEVTNVAALGSTSGVSLGTSSSSTAATFNYSGGNVTLNKDITALSTSRTGNTLQNSGDGLLTLTGNLNKNGTVLTLKGDMKVDGHIVGLNSGSDLVISSGTTTITSDNSYKGPTFIESGAKLIANNAAATGDGIVNVANGATLQVGDANHMLTLTTGGFALSNGAHIKIYINSLSTAHISTTHIDSTGATVYDQSSFAGTNYTSLDTAGLLDLSALTAGQGVTIDLYSTAGDNSAVTGLIKTALYDLKFLSFGSLSSGVTSESISSLFTINYNHLRDSNNDALYADTRIKVYLDKHLDGSGAIMMTIPEPSTYGLSLGALALALVAIRRRKQKKSVA